MHNFEDFIREANHIVTLFNSFLRRNSRNKSNTIVGHITYTCYSADEYEMIKKVLFCSDGSSESSFLYERKERTKTVFYIRFVTSNELQSAIGSIKILKVQFELYSEQDGSKFTSIQIQNKGRYSLDGLISVLKSNGEKVSQSGNSLNVIVSDTEEPTWFSAEIVKKLEIRNLPKEMRR